MKYKTICGFLSMALVLQPQCILADGVENPNMESAVIQEQEEAAEEPAGNTKREIDTNQIWDKGKNERADKELLPKVETPEEDGGDKGNKIQEQIGSGGEKPEDRKENPSRPEEIGDKNSQIGKEEKEVSKEMEGEESKDTVKENQDKSMQTEEKPESGGEKESQEKEKEEEEKGLADNEEETKDKEEEKEVIEDRGKEMKEEENRKEPEKQPDIEEGQETEEKADGRELKEETEGIDEETANFQNTDRIVSEKQKEQRSREESERAGGTAEDYKAGNQEAASGKMPVPEKKEQDDLKDVKIMVENIQPFCASSRPVTPKIMVENLQKDQGNVEVVLESRSQGVILTQSPNIDVAGRISCILPEILEDDQYILRIKEYTEEGMKEQAVVFSVNQAGTIFSYDQSKANVCLNESFSPQIRLKNVDTTEIVSCLINGKESTYRREGDQIMIDEKNLQEGKNQIVVAVRDQAGNMSVMEPWEFVIKHSEEKKTDLEKKKSNPEPMNFWEYLQWILEEMIPAVIEGDLCEIKNTSQNIGSAQ